MPSGSETLRKLIKHIAINPETAQLTAGQETALLQVFKDLSAESNAAVSGRIKFMISQAGTAAPTLTATMRNTLSGQPTPTLARTGVGVYTIAGLTTTAQKNKTFIIIGANAGKAIINAQVVASDLIRLNVYNDAGAAADDLVTDLQLEVEVFV